MKNLVWLRNDLRIDDNPVLTNATLQGFTEVVFFLCEKQWHQHDESSAKIGLRADVLKALAEQLFLLNIPFHLLVCDTFQQCAEQLSNFCQQQDITDVWFHREIPQHEQQRDDNVIQALTKIDIKTHIYDWDLLVPTPIYNQQGLPFKVFTPFYKAWLKRLENQNNTIAATPQIQTTLPAKPCLNEAFDWRPAYREDLWRCNHAELDHKIRAFCQFKMQDYPTKRDIPSIAGTSTLSPYLALGMIGPRYLLSIIQLECAEQGSNWRENDWLRELAWRDFYKQLMWHFPSLCQYKAFKPNTENLSWNQSDTLFQAWCDGKTGFPIVDAAMRQLKQTGWMHNRLRMVTASFLTKLLFIDWRKGEQFFMQHLIDGDFAANNGGWQWSASTGCDSVPYFRVFNPLRQSEKFDPDGDFIRRFIPELEQLDKKSIHNPSIKQRHLAGYPETIVDYKSARTHAISAFEKITKQKEGL